MLYFVDKLRILTVYLILVWFNNTKKMYRDDFFLFINEFNSNIQLSLSHSHCWKVNDMHPFSVKSCFAKDNLFTAQDQIGLNHLIYKGYLICE